jgi:glycosyltransferase involved in cell wall biosynthesis
VRILLWHGWLLEGSGSNVGTARVAEVLRAAGHDVLVLCQEPHPERYAWVDAFGSIGPDGPSDLTPNAAVTGAGRCVLLRPRIGRLIPVFVVDRYEGFDAVRAFVDLADEELASYLRANVDALRAAAAWHQSEFAFTGHAIPGAVIGRRALGPGSFVAKIHGSDIEYAVRLQDRYRELAREGLEAARAVVGPSEDVLQRCAELVPEMTPSRFVVRPGVDVAAFRPRARGAALRETARLLAADPDAARGRPASTDAAVERALALRDAEALDRLAESYDQEVPDHDVASKLMRLSEEDGPIVGYLGKLIPQKGVELLLGAHRLSRRDARALIVGFGSDREWLAALDVSLRGADGEALMWLREVRGMPIDPAPPPAPLRAVTFTGRLDHRYAPGALAAMDVQVVPSILAEAFGMVVAEGAAAGALPLVARHSGLAEVADALEAEIDRPGLLTFEPGAGAGQSLADGIDRLLSLPMQERGEMGRTLSEFVAREWSWETTAAGMLAAAGRELPDLR